MGAIALGLIGLAALFFVSPCRLSDERIRADLDKEQARVFTSLEETQALMNRNHANVGVFSLRLQLAFTAFNVHQKAVYALSAEGLRAKCPAFAYPLQWQKAHWDTLAVSIATSGDTYDFYRKACAEYGRWMHGRSYSHSKVLLRDLENVAEAVNAYAIPAQKGLADHKVAALVYAWTEDANQSPAKKAPLAYFLLLFGLLTAGAISYIAAQALTYGPAGIRNNDTVRSAAKNKSWRTSATALCLIALYIALYFYPAWITPWIPLFHPIAQLLSAKAASPFFCYGALYTLAIWIMGARFILKYRHSRYHLWRTASLITCQTAFAFIIPEILVRLNQPYFDFKNIWPLDYDFFFDTQLNTLRASGRLGWFMLGWGMALCIIGVPVLTYFFGKRWYCSWVCGCGGLAETMGDPYRHLSNKSIGAWRIERWSVHSVLVIATLMTVAVIWTYYTHESHVLGMNSYHIRQWYGALIGATFAGVVGTGFYPWMGSRVWCRFGCPLAAYLGIIQRLKSRFRITTNHGQCISCGNCSTYCEMGIDVRWYAQRNQDIVRASCVGCGVCASVCPRGVLKLENTNQQRQLTTPEPLS